MHPMQCNKSTQLHGLTNLVNLKSHNILTCTCHSRLKCCDYSIYLNTVLRLIEPSTASRSIIPVQQTFVEMQTNQHQKIKTATQRLHRHRRHRLQRKICGMRTAQVVRPFKKKKGGKNIPILNSPTTDMLPNTHAVHRSSLFENTFLSGAVQ